jgi:hypothetical protein
MLTLVRWMSGRGGGLLSSRFRSLGRDYREHLRTAVGSSAAPYGYTLATWTSGAVLTHAYGLPTAMEATAVENRPGRGILTLGAPALPYASKNHSFE